MPEGPESYIMSLKLKERLVGKSILGYSHNLKFKAKGVENFKFPTVILDVYSHGKRPIFKTTSGWIVTFLGLTARYLYEKNQHTVLTFEIGTFEELDEMTLEYHEFNIYLDDKRPFAFLNFLTTQTEHDLFFNKFGYDLNQYEPSSQEWLNLIRNKASKNMKVEDFLIEPKYICSHGNYARAETLYYAKIKPGRKLCELTDIEIETLRLTAVGLIRYVTEMGGCTLEDYLTPDGTMGRYKPVCYSHRFQLKTDLYGNPIEKIKGPNGRSMYWVPNVQK